MDRRLEQLRRDYLMQGPEAGYHYYQALRRIGTLILPETAEEVYRLGLNLGVAAIPVFEEIIDRYLNDTLESDRGYSLYKQAVAGLGHVAREYESGSKGDGPPVHGTGYTHRKEYLTAPSSDRGLPTLLRILLSPVSHHDEIIKSIRLIGNATAVPILCEYVDNYIDDPGEHVSQKTHTGYSSPAVVKAIEALAYFKDPRAIPTLIRAALGHHVTRQAAAEALGYITPTTPEAIETLHHLTTGAEPDCRSKAAAWSLGRIGNKSSIPYLVDLYHNGGNHETASTAIQAVGLLGGFDEIIDIVWDESLSWSTRIGAIPGLTACCEEVTEGYPSGHGTSRSLNVPVSKQWCGGVSPEQVAHALVDIFNSEGVLYFRLGGLLHLRDFCIPWVTDFIQDIALNPESYAADYRMQEEAERLVRWHEHHCE
jgi:hypothetical protein